MSVSYNIIYLIWLLLIVVSIISFYSSHSVSFFILLSFLVILSYSIQCSSNQDYVKITKYTGTYPNRESFEIVSGSSTLFTSPSFSNNKQYVYEVCLNASSNHIYTLIPYQFYSYLTIHVNHFQSHKLVSYIK